MVLLGLTGSIGHGKSTFADFLCNLEPQSIHAESWLVIAEIVTDLNKRLPETLPHKDDLAAVNAWLEPLGTITFEVTNVTVEPEKLTITDRDIKTKPQDYEKLWQYLTALQHNPALAKQSLTAETKEQFRPMLQWVGGYLVHKISPSIWYDELMRRAQNAAAAGCELFVVGGIRFPIEADIVRHNQGKVLEIVRPALQQKDLQDPTERERHAVRSDHQIVNDGSLAQLQKLAAQVLKDAKQQQLKPSYQASNC